MRALRFDSQILYHPLLRRLRPSQRWVFLTLLYLAGESSEGRLVLFQGEELHAQDLADQAGVTLKEVERDLERFLELGLLERRDGVLLLSSDWRKPSSSSERVRRYRRKVQAQKSDSLEKDETVKRVTLPLHVTVTSPLHETVTALHPQKEKAGPDALSEFSALSFLGNFKDILRAKKSAIWGSSSGNLEAKKGGFWIPKYEQKEKEERSKEERE
ncbi:MAG: hypothetical protein ACPLOU_08405, partial [bacterium]